MARKPRLPKGLRPLQPLRPLKPLDKLQTLKPLPGIGQTEGVRGHWRFNPQTGGYDWVKPHWRKPGR